MLIAVCPDKVSNKECFEINQRILQITAAAEVHFKECQRETVEPRRARRWTFLILIRFILNKNNFSY